MSTQTANDISTILQDKLTPEHIEVIDESHFHIGHAGAESGKGHYRLVIKGECFNELSLIKRHQLIYKALGELMQTKIHALSIEIIDDN